MKRALIFLIVIIAALALKAQNSDFFNYQAAVRDANSNPKANASVSVFVEILQGSVSGNVIYSETQSKTTSTLGILNLQIGSINPTGFSSIDWSNTPFFIRISIDGVEVGTSQLLSVPYALYSKKSGTYNETDPVFLAHPSSSISNSKITNWDAAFNWGNHASAGYLKSYTETDPIFVASAANGISASYITNWNTAYGWGDHALAGYLKSYTETDPSFAASAANGISASNITNWNTAYGWGDHALAGYLKSYTETDPSFAASAANGISASNITNWNTAYGWGNHSGLYKLISYTPDWSELTNKPFTINSPLNNQLLKYNNSSSKWENWTPNFLTAESQSLSLSTNQLTISSGNTITFNNWDTDKTDDVVLATPNTGDMLYYNGSNWTSIPKGTTGQVLTMNSSGIPEWQNSLEAPTASSSSASFSSLTSLTPTVTLNGTVNAGKLPTTVTFQYGTTTSYGTTVTASQSPVSGTTNTNVSYSITSGLVKGTTYHYRVAATNALGTTYGSDMTFTYLAIGYSYQGGIIFYLDNTGQHGLVAASSDQSTSAEWGCESTAITGADGTALGTGNQNTTDIVNGCSTSGTAAKVCYDLDFNGYSDWFLPSKDELSLMYTYLKLNGLGGFAATSYWSSSEYDLDSSWKQNFSTGATSVNLKNTTYYVRTIRTF